MIETARQVLAVTEAWGRTGRTPGTIRPTRRVAVEFLPVEYLLAFAFSFNQHYPFSHRGTIRDIGRGCFRLGELPTLPSFTSHPSPNADPNSTQTSVLTDLGCDHRTLVRAGRVVPR